MTTYDKELFFFSHFTSPSDDLYQSSLDGRGHPEDREGQWLEGKPSYLLLLAK